jgi:exonuclease III
MCLEESDKIIVMSLNVRGLNTSLKKIAVHKLVVLYNPGIILIQETMIKGSNAIDILKGFLKNWDFLAQDSIGRSGGLITAWKKNALQKNSGMLQSTVWTDLYSLDLAKNISVINTYGPYQN